jgi:hypothetical protein
MSDFAERLCGILHTGLLRGASLLVPMNLRAEWSREWHAELWHVRQSCAPEHVVLPFCLGAFQDAFCLRRNLHELPTPVAAPQGSALHCMTFLGGILAASYVFALLLPGVRSEQFLSRYRAEPGLVMIESANHRGSAQDITPAQFRLWTEHRQKYFDGLAFYRIAPETVSDGSQVQTGWEVAGASTNLFTLLGLPLRHTDLAEEGAGDLPRVILSDEVWQRDFGRNPNVAGSVLRVGGREARVAGVAPAGAWRMPGRVDAWLLEPEADLAAEGPGNVVAHLTAQGQAEMWTTRVPITAYKSDDSEDDLLGVALDQGTPTPSTIFLFAVLLAVLALPAITSLALDETSANSHRTSWLRRVYRWGFLAGKIALLLGIAYCASLDLGYCNVAITADWSVCLQLASAFCISLFGLAWALKDQRQRCPVCLRRVEHPAQVGQASRTFLDWNGTELMCMGGHTLLHVPGLPTSWFGAQRWLYLDTSWGFLFSGPVASIHNESL